MEKLVKISSIKHFRFFQEYKWGANLNPFKKNNIIYGWNGSGKSTLGDFFHMIEEGLSEPLCTFELSLQEENKKEQVSTHADINDLKNRFKVYHQSYANGLISEPDKVDHISIIGHDGVDFAKQIEDSKANKTKSENQRADEKNEKQKNQNDFNNYKRERATLVRSVTGYPQSYDYSKIYECYQKNKEPAKLSQLDYDHLSIAVKTKPKEKIVLTHISSLNSNMLDEISNVLSESPTYKTIEKLQQDTSLREWVDQGLSIHKNRSNHKTCEFCGNVILTPRWTELEDYFNDSLTNFKKNINETLSKLKNAIDNFNQYKVAIPHETQFSEEFITDYNNLKQQAISKCDEYVTFFEKTVTLVNIKNEKIIDKQCASEFQNLIINIDVNDKFAENINQLIDKHNKKTEDYKKSIIETQQKLENHIIAESAGKFIEYEKKVKNIDDNIAKFEDEIRKYDSQIKHLEMQIRNSRIPAERINKDIQFILNRTDLHFSWKENGYEIKRGDAIAENLSTGERNAVALIYFFNSLDDQKVSKGNIIVILDDPISSFDSNYYYSAVAYIYMHTKKFEQVFLLTHKFSVYKHFSRKLNKKDTNNYILERENNCPVIKNIDKLLHDFEDEYVYLFKKIYEFTKTPPECINDYLQYPNMARRLFESFVSFKVPQPNQKNSTVLEIAIKMDKNSDTPRINALDRLHQDKSHLHLMECADNTDGISYIKELPKILQHLLDFIEEHDKVHYDSLVRIIEQNNTANITTNTQLKH